MLVVECDSCHAVDEFIANTGLYDLRLARRQAAESALPVRPLERRREQLGTMAAAREQPAESRGVLLRQDLRGRHEGRLVAALHRHDHEYYLVIDSGDLVAGVCPKGGPMDFFVGKVPKGGNTVRVPKGNTEWAYNVGNETYHEILIELLDT